MIEEKERTGRVEEVAPGEGVGAPAEGQVVDIMALLKRSVDQVRGSRGAGAADDDEAQAEGASRPRPRSTAPAKRGGKGGRRKAA